MVCCKQGVLRCPLLYLSTHECALFLYLPSSEPITVLSMWYCMVYTIYGMHVHR
jgi:hypothetical protein